jgi:hypothetical protein
VNYSEVGDFFILMLSGWILFPILSCVNGARVAKASVNWFLSFFFYKLTYVLKEEDTNIIRGIPQIYNDNRNIKQQMATG